MAASWGLFPLPDGSFFLISPFLLVATGLVLAYAEISGNNLGYSKFAGGDDSKKLRVPSSVGMFLFYFPSALVSCVFLAYWIGFLPILHSLLKSCGAFGATSLFEQAVAASDTRLLLVIAAVFIHFTKRDLEVLFIHKFSGQTNVGAILFISSAYAATAALFLFTQVLSTGLAAPSLDLKWLGFVVYLVGITGNGYHHWLLSHLRKDDNKQYVVPQGGLFGLLVCPHYIFEMVTFLGMALMSQTLAGCCMALLVFLYLTARTIKTKQWYMKKVDGFPKERSVLIPGVF